MQADCDSSCHNAAQPGMEYQQPHPFDVCSLSACMLFSAPAESHDGLACLCTSCGGSKIVLLHGGNMSILLPDIKTLKWQIAFAPASYRLILRPVLAGSDAT